MNNRFSGGDAGFGGGSSSFMDDPQGKLGRIRDPVVAVARWVKLRDQREKGILLGLLGLVTLCVLYWVVRDHTHLFVLAEMVHIVGIGALVYKIQSKRSAAALSLRTQELTFIFLFVRLYCSLLMEYDIHTFLDFATLVATGWVIYSIRFKLKHTYLAQADTVKLHYVVAPCLLLAVFIKPKTTHHYFNRIMWALCVYLEAVSVYPQLKLLQNLKVVTDTYTSHYVFALGVSRFFSCAHWVLQFVDQEKDFIEALGSGVWPVFVVLSELTQTVILADFCWHYLKAMAAGVGTIRLPV